MTTAWMTLPGAQRRQWLLADGTTVTEPELEHTTSGRKVRIKAMPELNCFSREVDSIMERAVTRLAQAQGTMPWLNLKYLDEQPKRGDAASLHLAKPSAQRQRGASTRAWFHFKHPDLPVEATLTITLTTSGSLGNTAVRPQELTTQLHFPDTRRTSWYTTASLCATTNDPHTWMPTDSWQQREDLRKMLASQKPAFLAEIKLGSLALATERDGAKALLNAVGAADRLDSVQVIDMRDPMQPGLLELEFVGSNLDSAFIPDLQDYLDGLPTVEEASGHYESLIGALRTAGMVIEAQNENDFLAALVGGQKEAITMRITGQLEGESLDHNHTVVMHLPTGTVSVECSVRALNKSANQGDVAQAWEESLIRAQLTGQEDTLLAYARQYVADTERRRTQTLITDRKHRAQEA